MSPPDTLSSCNKLIQTITGPVRTGRISTHDDIETILPTHHWVSSSAVGPNDWARVAVFCDDTSPTAALCLSCWLVGSTQFVPISILRTKTNVILLVVVMAITERTLTVLIGNNNNNNNNKSLRH